MKYILLPRESEKVHYYKVNMHCHTCLTDGVKTPEEIKEIFKARGYAAVAFTDHHLYCCHNDTLTDDEFIALNSFETNIYSLDSDYTPRRQTCHFNSIALDPENREHPLVHKELPIETKAGGVYLNYPYVYHPEYMNFLMHEAHSKGFFVVYCHPVWSLENYDVYSQYDGMDALEICNFASANGFTGDAVAVYDDLLRLDRKIGCVAGDDNHNYSALDSPFCDSFGGYTWVWAERLDYRSITDALVKGHYYASHGLTNREAPKILSIVYDDEAKRVYVETTPCRNVSITCDVRYCKQANAYPGKPIEACDFPVPEEAKCFRVTVEDERGLRSFSNAYFLEDFATGKYEADENVKIDAGPQIKTLSFDRKTRVLHIETTPVESIWTDGNIITAKAYANAENGKPVTGADFHFGPEVTWIIVYLVDENGRRTESKTIGTRP